jgi:hypothetical protein
VEDLAADPRTAARASAAAGPTVAIPMRSEKTVTGVLFVCRKPGGATF